MMPAHQAVQPDYLIAAHLFAFHPKKIITPQTAPQIAPQTAPRCPISAALKGAGTVDWHHPGDYPTLFHFALMKDYTKDLSGPFYLDPRSPRPAPYNEVEEGGLKIRESPTPPDISIVDYDLLVDKVRGIRSSLVTVETECIQIENAQTSITNILTASDKQGQAVPARLVSRGGMRKLARRFSRRSRTWRRLNDQLLPLLHRNQDFELSRQLLTATKLYTSLLGLLNRIKLVTGVLEDALFKGYSRLSHPVLFSWRNISYYSAEQELLNLLHQIETIFARLQEKFRTKYDELIRNGSLIGAIATEVTLTDVIFEFPNNIRHICTTMPWTISLVLAVLWGVCWMFYTSAPGIEPEVPLETAEPSATFDFNYDPGGEYPPASQNLI